MKLRFVKMAMVVAAISTMVLGSTIVSNAEYFAKPRLASQCNQSNCTGEHVSVYNASTGLNLYYCVPSSWVGSADSFRTRAEQFFAEEAGAAGVAKAADYSITNVDHLNFGAANVAVAPVDVRNLVSYFGTHKPNSNCNGNNCKGHVFVKNPATGTDLCYCVPEGWSASIDEYQTKLQEYFNLRHNGLTTVTTSTEFTTPALSDTSAAMQALLNQAALAALQQQ